MTPCVYIRLKSVCLQDSLNLEHKCREDGFQLHRHWSEENCFQDTENASWPRLELKYPAHLTWMLETCKLSSYLCYLCKAITVYLGNHEWPMSARISFLMLLSINFLQIVMIWRETFKLFSVLKDVMNDFQRIVMRQIFCVSLGWQLTMGNGF